MSVTGAQNIGPWRVFYPSEGKIKDGFLIFQDRCQVAENAVFADEKPLIIFINGILAIENPETKEGRVFYGEKNVLKRSYKFSGGSIISIEGSKVILRGGGHIDPKKKDICGTKDIAITGMDDLGDGGIVKKVVADKGIAIAFNFGGKVEIK